MGIQEDMYEDIKEYVVNEPLFRKVLLRYIFILILSTPQRDFTACK